LGPFILPPAGCKQISRNGSSAATEQEGDEVAAIILKPVTGIFAGTPEYFAARRLADEHGTLLICDEVITLRLGVGGFQEVLGVRPVLTTMGKIIGSGLPVGAFGGRVDVMEVVDEVREACSRAIDTLPEA